MIDITIPKLGLTMESARIADWKFRSGDDVKKGQTVLIIETDKAIIASSMEPRRQDF
jgi:pyruvate/2-oxoglutarate dehydrogenase complex dihydrolipoamide acyltransferase (E2) component